MTLADIQSLIRRREYRSSAKVNESISDGFFTTEDLECCIETATEIFKKERDEKRRSVDGFKYTIIGFDRRGFRFYTAGKVMRDFTGRFYFFITAHEAD